MADARTELRQYFISRALSWRAELEQLDAEVVRQIVSVLRRVRSSVRSRLDLDAIAAMPYEAQRLRAINTWTEEVIAGADSRLQKLLNEAVIAAAAASVTAYNGMMSFDGAARMVQTVGLTAEQIRSWFVTTPLGAGGLQKWVDKAFDDGIQKKILTVLQEAGVEGKGISATVDRILAEGLGVTESEAVTLARTFIQQANVSAAQAVYDANDDLITGYQWTAILDLSVCPHCASLDGVVYKKDEKRPPIPLHPRCRCLLLPVTKTYRELGLDIDEMERASRNWLIHAERTVGEGGRRRILEAGTTNGSYGDWYMTLPWSQQVEILGVKRARLLRDGRISWADLIDHKTGRYNLIKDFENY